MESVTLKEINDLLKDAPSIMLERVFGYIQGLMDEDSTRNLDNFELTDEQRKNLEEIAAMPISEHTDIDTFVSEMKTKYGI